MRQRTGRLIGAFVAAAVTGGAFGLAAPALAQNSITIVREVDSDRYDPHRSTARAASEVLFMLGDTLVSLDYDMSSIKPGLAESWTVSPDGKTYTFKIRSDVQYCDGRKMTAEDVVYSLKRWIDPATRSPVRWRAGDVEDIVAKDATTIEYKLKAPFSELLYQLTQSFAIIIDKAQVETLGADFGVKGFNGTGPFCWVDWKPRNEFRLKRHDAYKWAPPIYENKGAAHVQEIVWRIVPEENTRLAAVMTGQSQITQYVPYSGMATLRANPRIKVVESNEAFWTYFVGFKIDKETVNDATVRRAMVMAVDQEAIAKNLYFGEVQPAYSYISQEALDWNKAVDAKLIKTNVAEANRILDAAGWVRGSDGLRAKDGKKLSPLVYGFTGSTWQKHGGGPGRSAQDRRRHAHPTFRRDGGVGQARHAGIRHVRDELSLHLRRRRAEPLLPLHQRTDAQPDELEGRHHGQAPRRRQDRPRRQGPGRRLWPGSGAGPRGRRVAAALPRAHEDRADDAARACEGAQHLRLRSLQGPRSQVHQLKSIAAGAPVPAAPR
jgi:peptide/nickel transport system substrate-binding protein